MSFESQISQQVANLTNRLNTITEQARKIFQLPWQNILRPSSKFQVSNDEGVSEFVTIQQVVDAALSFRQNQLLEANITVDENDITVDSGAKWIINNVNYELAADFTETIPYAEDGYTRNDILYADQFNQIHRLTGPETEGVSPTPNTPLNTVLVTVISVTDSTIGNTPPIIGSDYELIANKTDTVIGNEASTSLYLNILGAVNYFQQKLTDITFGAFINSLDFETTPGDSDGFPMYDYSDGNNAKKITWLSIKLMLRSYFDEMYATVGSVATKADLVAGKVPASQLPSYVDDVVEGFLLSNIFYLESGHTTVIPAETGKIYIDLTTGQKNKSYRYSGSTYIQITNGLIASTTDVPEGSNLYFTDSRVLSLFDYITENEYGIHPSFSNQNDLNAWLLGFVSGGLEKLNKPTGMTVKSENAQTLRINWNDTNS